MNAVRETNKPIMHQRHSTKKSLFYGRFIAWIAFVGVLSISVITIFAETVINDAPEWIVVRVQEEPKDRIYILVPSLSEIALKGSFLCWETPYAISPGDIEEGISVHVVQEQEKERSVEAIWWFMLKHGLFLLLDPSLTDLCAFDNVDWDELTKESWAYRNARLKPYVAWSHAVVDIVDIEQGAMAATSVLTNYIDRLSELFHTNICLDFAMGTQAFPIPSQVQWPRVAVLRSRSQEEIERVHRRFLSKGLTRAESMGRQIEDKIDYEKTPLEQLWAQHLWIHIPERGLEIVEVDTKRNIVIIRSEGDFEFSPNFGFWGWLEPGNVKVAVDVIKATWPKSVMEQRNCDGVQTGD